MLFWKRKSHKFNGIWMRKSPPCVHQWTKATLCYQKVCSEFVSWWSRLYCRQLQFSSVYTRQLEVIIFAELLLLTLQAFSPQSPFTHHQLKPVLVNRLLCQVERNQSTSDYYSTAIHNIQHQHHYHHCLLLVLVLVLVLIRGLVKKFWA